MIEFDASARARVRLSGLAAALLTALAVLAAGDGLRQPLFDLFERLTPASPPSPKVQVVLIDAPGHAEFLRNMITGASQADGALLIVDALEGVRDQTRRHGYLLHLLGVKQVAVVVNKMDRVDFSSARFAEIRDEISAHLTALGVTPLAVIPISARDGDGVAAL